ncbi:hypothetical protein [Roseimaritima ulvae]|uniref:Uncharacterized protein n=1 Tax=Roseimaritima ulvae TaxID=980254 RepID=A0A5B9QQE4_9BACT|nr:hypothetical protein [Roseimaritima ulvae]QEG40129.1 hypothetical protein UC8_21350 [Roseimaritima ulvae]
MYQQLNCLWAGIYLAACMMIVGPSANRAFGDQPVQGNATASIAADSSEQISDWALAGIVWSDASLTKKLAVDALKRQPSAEDRQRLETLVDQSSRIIAALEQFGWKQTRSATRGTSGELAAVNRFEVDGIVGSPQATSGRTAPASVEDATTPGPEAELEPFGVEDYVDETPREAANLRDAREDGVEAAIAAAAPSSGIPGPEPGAGRISQREVQTRSTTLPYSNESIYDADDYDPDVDYQVNNPLAAKSVNPRNTDLLDDDREVAETREVVEVSTPLERYTADAADHQQDAAWVQLRLKENQLRYGSLVANESLNDRVLPALQQLQTTAMIAHRSTSSKVLKSVLEPIATMGTVD